MEYINGKDYCECEVEKWTHLESSHVPWTTITALINTSNTNVM